VYVRLVATCPTCGMRVNGKRFSEVYPDLDPKAMFTVIKKGVKGLNTEVRDVASDPESQKVVASVEQALALSLLDTLSGYWEVYPWLREETLRKLRAVVSPSELKILSPSRMVSPSGGLRIQSPTVTVGPWTKMETGASVRVASTSEYLRMGSPSRLPSSRTAPRKSSTRSPRAPGGVLNITSPPGMVKIESASQVHSE